MGHGSKAKGFNRAMLRVARRLRQTAFRDVRCAYLEINSPSIPEAVRQAVRRGARDVRVLPYFVLTGNHVKKDIPRLVRLERDRWKRKAKVRLCPYLGYDERIVSVVKERIRHV